MIQGVPFSLYVGFMNIGIALDDKLHSVHFINEGK